MFFFFFFSKDSGGTVSFFCGLNGWAVFVGLGFFFFLNNMGRVWLSGWFFLVGRVKMDRVKRGSVFSGSGYVFSKEKRRLWVTFAGWGCWFGGVTCD